MVGWKRQRWTDKKFTQMPNAETAVNQTKGRTKQQVVNGLRRGEMRRWGGEVPDEIRNYSLREFNVGNGGLFGDV